MTETANAGVFYAAPPPAAAVTASFQQSQGQAEVLKPSQMFYRGVAGRMG